MKKNDWKQISKAKELFGLDDTATLKQIKNAYRRMSKKCHPDLEGQQEHSGAPASMAEVNEAYQVLLTYCENFSYPLTPKEDEQPMDAEDWWMDRFGPDPLWGGEKKGYLTLA